MIKYGSILLGLAGFILFFPFNLGNGHSCLAHKFFKSTNSVHIADHQNHQQSRHIPEMQSVHKHHLLNQYLFPFAFLWWASIGLMVYQLRHTGFTNHSKKIRNAG
jgi:hypothetical protein